MAKGLVIKEEYYYLCKTLIKSTMKTAFGLVRTSTPEQGLDTQVESIRSIAKELKYEIKEGDIFAEQISGYDEPDHDRESIVKLREEIEIRHPEAIFIYELSRLTRRATKVFHYIDILSLQPKVPMYFADYEIWTIKPETGEQNDKGIWKLMGGAESVENERERIRVRTSTGRNAKARKGYYVGHLSDGFYWEYENGEKVIKVDEERENVIKTIFKLYVENEYSTGDIRDYLIEKDIPTTNRYRFENPNKFRGYKEDYKDRSGNISQRQNILWTDSMVSGILTNKWYIGIRKYKGEEYTIKDRIIDDDTWNKAQKRLESLRFKTGNTKRPYLLNGLLFCGVCGRKLYGHGDGYSNMYYCSSKEYGTKHKCGLRWIRQENLDAIVLEILKNRALNQSWIGKENRIADFFSNDKKEIKKIDDRIKLYSSKVNRLNGEIDKKYKEIENLINKQLTHIDDERLSAIFDSKIKDKKDEIKRTEAEITKTKIDIDRLRKDRRMRTSLKNQFKKIENLTDFDDAKRLVNSIVKRITIYNADAQSSIVNIKYYNDIEDTAIYCPDKLKKNFIYIWQGDHIEYNTESKKLQFKGYYLVCKQHQQELVSYLYREEDVSNSEIEFDSNIIQDVEIEIPQWDTDENRKKYVDRIEKAIELGLISETDKESYLEFYNSAVEDKRIWRTEDDIIEWYKKQDLTPIKDEIDVIDYIKLLKKYSLHIYSYNDLLPMSENGIRRKNYHDEYIKKYNSGRPSAVEYIQKDANYESIQKERKHLYNRKYKILNNKHLTESERDAQIMKIEAKLESFKAQLKYMPTNAKGIRLKEKYNKLD